MKRAITIALLLAAATLGCRGRRSSGHAQPPRALTVPQPPREPGERWDPQAKADTARVVEIFRKTLIDDTDGAPLMRRDAHPRHHACVKGVLEIDPSRLREDQRQGLLAQAGEYQAWVRFSNGDPNPSRDDDRPDFRGMAVKVMQVPYSSYLTDIGLERKDPTHDLLLINSPTFFIRDAAQYVELMEAMDRGKLSLARFMMTNASCRKTAQAARKMAVGNVLDLDYHSATPYKLGAGSMRMTMRSCKEGDDAVPRRASAHFLGDRLEAALAEQEHCFVFQVQPNADPERNPIEDPLLTWDTKVSPVVEVGRLRLLRQQGVRSPEAMALCEHMSFNPWRAPVANRPLGQVNRVRLEAYARQSQLRYEHNQVEPPRPRDHSGVGSTPSSQ